MHEHVLVVDPLASRGSELTVSPRLPYNWSPRLLTPQAGLELGACPLERRSRSSGAAAVGQPATSPQPQGLQGPQPQKHIDHREHSDHSNHRDHRDHNFQCQASIVPLGSVQCTPDLQLAQPWPGHPFPRLPRPGSRSSQPQAHGPGAAWGRLQCGLTALPAPWLCRHGPWFSTEPDTHLPSGTF